MPYGTLGADVVQSSTAGTPPQFKDGNGTQTGTLCRAWVNFNGTGTVAIRASFNVSSITDNGTGDYTVNFTNAMPDANYSWCFADQYNNTGSVAYQNILPMVQDGLNQVTASSLRFNCVVTSSATRFDSAIVSVAIFR